MTERKWTPGPWRLVEGKVKNDGHRSVHISGGGWAKFARVFVRVAGSGEDNPEGIANANIVAAAPDLFEALEMAMNDGVQMRPNTIRAAQAALAKARGEA